MDTLYFDIEPEKESTSLYHDVAGLIVFKIINFTRIYYLLIIQVIAVDDLRYLPIRDIVLPKETPLEAAFGATFHLTDLKEKDLKVIPGSATIIMHDDHNCRRNTSVYFWAAELTNPNARVQCGNEVHGFKWLSIDEALDKMSCKTNMERNYKYVLKYYEENIFKLKSNPKLANLTAVLKTVDEIDESLIFRSDRDYVMDNIE